LGHRRKKTLQKKFKNVKKRKKWQNKKGLKTLNKKTLVIIGLISCLVPNAVDVVYLEL